MISRVVVVGTGLIGASVGLALKAGGFSGEVLGWDASAAELAEALRVGAVDAALSGRDAVLSAKADVFVLATPVMPILDWMHALAETTSAGQLITDVGSTKREIAELARKLYGGADKAAFLPGHPMAGKASGGAALAEGKLFSGATWLFTPVQASWHPFSDEWRSLVAGFGAEVRDLDPVRHDEVCAWVSHMPQMVSTAVSAMLQETFSDDPAGMAAVRAIGGRALREMTRLGSSPYSMWRDVALTNSEPIAQTLMALEQRLAHLRENLRTAELRAEFRMANRFRAKRAE